MTTVNIKLDRKKKYRNAFYMMSIERAIIATLVVGDYLICRFSTTKSRSSAIMKYSLVCCMDF